MGIVLLLIYGAWNMFCARRPLMREPRLGSLIAALPPSDEAAGRDDRSRDQSRSSETSQFIRDSPPTHYRECRYAASVLDVTASEPLS